LAWKLITFPIEWKKVDMNVNTSPTILVVVVGSCTIQKIAKSTIPHWIAGLAFGIAIPTFPLRREPTRRPARRRIGLPDRVDVA
jgi:hypothetical protein